METIHKQKPVSKREFYLALIGFVLGTALGVLFFSAVMPDTAVQFAKMRKAKSGLIQEEGEIEAAPATLMMNSLKVGGMQRMMAEPESVPSLADIVTLNNQSIVIAKDLLKQEMSPQMRDVVQTIVENREKEAKLLEGVR